MKNKSPLISVIMPAYNTEQYIGQAIKSILKQTHKNLELIIIDDCSTDGTRATAESYAQKDTRIHVFHNKKNSKQWFCRNLGIEKARGDYIAWMDADDVCMPTRLEKQLTYLNKNKKADMVGTYIKFIDKNNKEITGEHYNEWFKKILTHPCVNDHGLYVVTIPASFFFKKSVLSKLTKPYFRAIALGEDMDFQFRLMEKKIKIYNMPNVLYHYRLHSRQSTNHKNNLALCLSLLRYAADCRRQLGFDPLDDMIKKYKIIDEKTMIPALITMVKIKKLSHHANFFADWMQYGIRYNADHLSLLLTFIRHQPIIFITQALLLPLRIIYGKMPFAHKPWNDVKNTLRLKKK